MRQIFTVIIMGTLVLAFTISCGGNKGTPVSPDEAITGNPGLTAEDGLSNNQDETTGGKSDTETPDFTQGKGHPLQGQEIQGSHELWGLYQFVISPDRESIEITPLRAANFHLNVIQFLEPNGKPKMVQLASGLTWNNDKTILDLDIRFVHPFPGATQFSGFDVKGILISNGTKAGFSDPDLIMADTNETRLLNADGYTRWWNPFEFKGNNIFAYKDGALGTKDSVAHYESTLNGYKYFCDSLDKDEDVENLDVADRGVFWAGKSNVRHFKLGLGSGLVFNYAIDASWAIPDVKPPSTPAEFPPGANQPEPWRVSAVDTEDYLYYVSPSDQGGYMKLAIRVYDWQGPLQPPLGTVEQVVIEWPGLFMPTQANFVADQGTYSEWQVMLTPTAGALTSSDDVEYLIWAQSTDGSGYGGILDPDEPLISANRCSAKVWNVKPIVPPIVDSGVTGNESPKLVNETYTVVAHDIFGEPLTYLWSVEPIGNPYNFDDPGNGDGTIDIDWSTFGPGAFIVQCQVSNTANDVLANELAVNPGNTPPIPGMIQGPKDVDASYTAAKYSTTVFDPDPGQTITYLWSFVLNGQPPDFSIPGDPGDGSMTIDYSTIVPGIYDINVQVSDGFANVPAFPITVTHHNTPPTVGTVTGKTPVTSLDTDEVYQATWSDPDTTQTLTFLWSIVPAGQAEDFSIPSPGGSINVDWSTYSVGNWDINLQAGDGIDITTGTKLTITKNNTLPTVGEVIGETDVSSANTDEIYTAEPISDIDPDQTLTVMWSIVPTGDAEDFSIPAEADHSLVVDWSTYSDNNYDVNVRIDDGYDQVESTPLIVCKFDNTPPTVGDVTGPETVNCSDTNAHYSASVFDPDTGQTLTYSWSLESSGSPENFDDPGNGDGTIDIDWSGYPFGDYDLNLQVDDGFGPVEGTPLTITKENFVPEIGKVTGPTLVSIVDVSQYSLDPATYDCDLGQTITYTFSVEPKGSPADYSIPGGTGSIDVDWSTYGVGIYEIGCAVSDGITVVYASPMLEVTVTLAPCEGTVHEFTGDLNPDQYSIAPYSVVPRADVAFLESGVESIKGYGIVQTGPSTIGVFDADNPGSTDVLLTYFLGKKDSVMSMDSDKIGGRILVVTGKDPHLVKIIDSSIIFGDPIIGTIDSGNANKTWVAIDIESDGNFWAVLRDGTSGVKYYLMHYNYHEKDPYYEEDSPAMTDITSVVGTESDIFDIAIADSLGMLYLLDAGPDGDGRIASFTIDEGEPASYDDEMSNIFSQVLDYDNVVWTGWAGFADIDIDNMESDSTRCRILVYGRLEDLTGELVRLDNQFNVLDTESYSEAWPAFAINVDESESVRNLIMPSTDSLAFFGTPVDW